jgi:hypothetical protein
MYSNPLAQTADESGGGVSGDDDDNDGDEGFFLPP